MDYPVRVILIMLSIVLELLYETRTCRPKSYTKILVWIGCKHCVLNVKQYDPVSIQDVT